jgi:hydrogenase maturation protease
MTAIGARRIVCVGNRYVPDDDVGARVHELLAGAALPAGVELVDGGLGGLDLLRFVEDAERVVFVDALRGHGATGRILLLEGAELLGGGEPRYGHSGGLDYLVGLLPALCGAALPQLVLIGFEGRADDSTVSAMAEMALRLAGDAS